LQGPGGEFAGEDGDLAGPVGVARGAELLFELVEVRGLFACLGGVAGAGEAGGLE